MINSFEHRQAGHCESGVTSNLLHDMGMEISEPMVLGIGAGLFFAYLPFVKFQYAPMTTFRILPGMIFNRATKALGVNIYKNTFKNPKASMDALDRALEQGHPVGLQVGTYHLPFFPPEYRMHYNMHNMVVYGRENGTYHVSDTVLPQVQTISYDDLMRVRFPKGVFAPNGRMYYPMGVVKKKDLHKAIYDGIKKTSHDMIKLPVPVVGVKGIRYLAKRMANWPEKFGDKKASYYLGQVLRMEEEIGTGGAGFRFIYGAFLQEAAETLQSEKLSELAMDMGRNANRWREFSFLGAKNCKNRSNIEVSFPDLSEILLDCADREDKIFNQLLTIKR